MQVGVVGESAIFLESESPGQAPDAGSGLVDVQGGGMR